MKAVKYLKRTFFGAVGKEKVVRSAMEHFPDVDEVKQALEQVIGKFFKATTTNATATNMTVQNNAPDTRFVIGASSTVMYEIAVVARQTAGSGLGSSGIWKFDGFIRRDASNNTVLVANDSGSKLDAGASAFSVAVSADDTNEALQIQVTGEASKTISWVAYVKYHIAS